MACRNVVCDCTQFYFSVIMRFLVKCTPVSMQTSRVMSE